MVLAVAPEQLGSAKADAQRERPAGSGARSLILGSKDGAQPENIEQFLTAVTEDVDSYWTRVFKDSGLPEPTSRLHGDPRRSDRGERLRRRERHPGRQRCRVLPR